MNIIFSIQGGIGKAVASTAVCKAIKRKYPDSTLIVISGYPDVYISNPYVDMSYGFGQESYFYTKYVENKEVLFFISDPYNSTNHLLSKEHLIQTWCNLYNLEYNGEMPEIYLNERERVFYFHKYKAEKPIMVIQTNGGAPNQESRYSWSRDMPSTIAQAVIAEFHNKYTIYHIRRDDQFQFENTIPLFDNFKGVAAVIQRSEKRILIDSFAQHTAAALGLKSTVLWIVNKPSVFGYDMHHNIVANPETAKPDLRNSMFTKYNIGGSLNEFPYNSETEMFDIDTIIESVIAQ